MSGHALDPLLLRHPHGVTELLCGEEALAEAIPRHAELFRGRSLFVISTDRVLRLHGERLAPLRDLAPAAVFFTVPEGEAAKSLAEAGRLWDSMLTAGGRRDSLVVAFGGGSVGDLAGFVAACFLRGVLFVQIPTTLLAQVDAAIGGKSAVDLPAAKNSVGAFHHPALVISDCRLLLTLPPAELRAGLVEAVKMAALLDPDLLARLERDLEALLSGDPAALAPVVRAAAAAKAGLVERDPEESGERQLLNYGHTLGHALESAAGYGRLLHGDAVAWGMRFAGRLARARGADVAFLDRIERLLDRLDSPVPPVLRRDDLMARMARDKKARAGGLTWVLPMALGRGERRGDVSPQEVDRELERFLADVARRRAPV